MSKSLGNVIDPVELVEKYTTDAVRYFLLREIPSLGDGDFSYAKFEHRYNSDLANGLGNLLSRTINLANKLGIDDPLEDNISIAFARGTDSVSSKEKYKKALEEFKFNEALAAVWKIVRIFDSYIEREKPWEGGDNAKNTVSEALYGLKEIAGLLKPFLPETSEKILQQLESKEAVILFPKI